MNTVLRHYVLQKAATVNNKLLLHARAKFYYRTGRLLQSWPRSQVAWVNAYVQFQSCGCCVTLRSVATSAHYANCGAMGATSFVPQVACVRVATLRNATQQHSGNVRSDPSDTRSS